MEAGSSTVRCLVCGEETENSQEETSAEKILSCSGSSAGEFLVGFNVVNCSRGAQSSFTGERLCKPCFEVVVNCDQWNFMLTNGLELLKSKAAAYAGREAADIGLLQPKIEPDIEIGCLDPLDESSSSSSSSSDSDSYVPKEENYNGNAVAVKSRPLPDSGLRRPRRQTVPKRYASSASPSPTRTRKQRRVRKPELNFVEEKFVDGKKKKERLEKSCPVCYTPVSHSDYETHFRDSHPGVQRHDPIYRNLMECPKCEYVVKKFERRFIDINRHLVVKHGLGDRTKVYRIKCPQCDEMVMTKAVLDSHMHIVHGAEKSITCEECGAMFSNSGSLKTHMYMKHPTERQRRICPHCGAEFNYMDYYTHLKTAHADIHGPRKTHACPLCGKEYRIPKKLKNHMASVHKVGQLDPKPKVRHVCPDCGREFSIREFYYYHIFKEHGKELPGLKKYVCPHCDEVKYTANNFKAHLMLHSDKRHVCEECGYETRFSENMNKHKKKLHGKKTKFDLEQAYRELQMSQASNSDVSVVPSPVLNS